MLPSKKAGKSIRSSNTEISSSVEGGIVRMLVGLGRDVGRRPDFRVPRVRRLLLTRNVLAGL
jgi:hypothetical protein